MKLLQIGAPKSGNYWLYKIVRSTYDLAGWPQPTYVEKQPIYQEAINWQLSYPEQAQTDVVDIEEDGVYWRISSRHRELINDLDAYLSQGSHVWSHSDFCGRSLDVMRCFDRVVYILRDPRDVLISRAKFLMTPYMQEYYPHFYASADEFIEKKLEGNITHWLRHVGFYLRHAREHSVHVMFYENMIADLPGEISRFHAYLGLEPDADRVEAVRQQVTFEAMKGDSPGHVRQGRAYGWTKNMTPEQQARVIRVAEPLLRLLNYPLSPEECATKLPSLPEEFRYDPPPRYEPPRPPLWRRVAGRLRRELSRVRS